MIKVILRRGPEYTLDEINKEPYEIVYTTDTNTLFVWDPEDQEWVNTKISKDISRLIYNNMSLKNGHIVIESKKPRLNKFQQFICKIFRIRSKNDY